MDRNIVFPGAIPQDVDLLSPQRNVMVALGALMRATLGANTVVDGLACTPTTPASLTVTVGPGSITAYTPIDETAYGGLAAATDGLVKMGVNTGATAFPLSAPATSGQSINYLLQASFQEQDTAPVVLPYYNSSNPAEPYSGPQNTGTAQNTQRTQRVQLQLKPGAAANAGTQATPAVDNGWIGLYVVTVNYGQIAVQASDIQVLPTAPFVAFKLPQIAPGVSRMAVINSSRVWTVPAGVGLVRVRLWGGGGAGGPGGGGPGGGGAGGGYFEGYCAVTPGQSLQVTIGAGGVQGSGNGAGSTTSFGALASASGGGAGASGAANTGGIASSSPGSGAGQGMTLAGSQGQNGLTFPGGGTIGGMGGGTFGTAPSFAPAGSSSTSLAGQSGSVPGGGGSGGIGSGGGGAGAQGLAIIEY